MASNQMFRRDNTADEREVRLPEKDRVPKMTSHFEHLAEKASGDKDRGKTHHGGGGEGAGHFESLADQVKGIDISGAGETDRKREPVAKVEVVINAHAGQGQGQRHEQPSGGGDTRQFGGQTKDTMSHGAGHGQQFGSQAKSTMDQEQEKRQTFGGQERSTMSHGAQGLQGQQFGTQGHGAQALQGQGQQFGGQTMDTMSHGAQGRQFGSQAQSTKSHGAEGQGRQFGSQEKSTMSHGGKGESAHEKHEQPSLDEVTKLRQKAQQNTMAALMEAEDRYAKARQSQTQNLEHNTNKSVQEKDTICQKTGVTEHGDQAKQSQELTKHGQEEEEEEEEEEMVDALEDVETEEGFAIKDTVMSAAQKTKETVLTAAEKTKDLGVPVAKKTAEYAGKAAVGAKDTAVVAGWSTAQLTATAAVEGTRLAAKAVQGVAGYVVPVATTVGQKGAEIASKSFHAATDVALSTGETAKEYAARKKEEARREREAKNSDETQGQFGTDWSNETEEFTMGGRNEEGESKPWKEGSKQYRTEKPVSDIGFSQEEEWEAQRGAKDSKPGLTMQQREQGVQEDFHARTGEQAEEGRGAGVLQAIGETIVEIAQTTKDLVIGHDEPGAAKDEFGAKGGGGI